MLLEVEKSILLLVFYTDLIEDIELSQTNK
jgi:hypothetical protein